MLKIDELSLSYGGIPALSGVSMQMRDGEFVAVVGRNGAGKSSLLKAIAGFEAPERGRIVFDGVDITRMRAARRAEMGIGYVMDGRRVFRTLSVIENLRVGGFIHRKDRRRTDTRLEHIFDLFPVLQRKAKMPSSALSGGEQQMLVVGQALMAEPRLLMLDEPSAGLAPRIAADLIRKLATLHREGMDVLLVEQFVRQALRVSSRAYVLDKGRMVIEGMSEALIQDPTIEEVYIGRLALGGSGGIKPKTGSTNGEGIH
jgi:branched-chain amino acid transport system ATP-binding protein